MQIVFASIGEIAVQTEITRTNSEWGRKKPSQSGQDSIFVWKNVEILAVLPVHATVIWTRSGVDGYLLFSSELVVCYCAYFRCLSQWFC